MMEIMKFVPKVFDLALPISDLVLLVFESACRHRFSFSSLCLFGRIFAMYVRMSLSGGSERIDSGIFRVFDVDGRCEELLAEGEDNVLEPRETK